MDISQKCFSWVSYPCIIFTLQKYHFKSLIKNWWDLGTTFSWAIIISYFICSWYKPDKTTKESKFHWICRRRHIAKRNIASINFRSFLCRMRKVFQYWESTVYLIGMQGFCLEILLDLWFARKLKKAHFKPYNSQLNWFVCVLTHIKHAYFPTFFQSQPMPKGKES